MDDSKLSRVSARLLRAGVAPRHVRRSVEELRAHRSDLIAQLLAQGLDESSAREQANARMGAPDDFIAATIARPELRGWASRAPWLVFAVLPVVAFCALAVGVIVLVTGYLQFTQPSTGLTDPRVWRVGALTLASLVQWVLPLGLCALLSLVAWRSGSRPVWPAIGALLVAALAAALTLQLTASHVGARGELSVGAGFPPRELGRSLLLFAVALSATVLIGLRKRRIMRLSSTVVAEDVGS